MIFFFNICSICFLLFAAKSVRLTCTYALTDLQDLCCQLPISLSIFRTPASIAEKYLMFWEQRGRHSMEVHGGHLALLRRAGICLRPTPLLTVPKILIYLSTTLQFRASSGTSTSVVFSLWSVNFYGLLLNGRSHNLQFSKKACASLMLFFSSKA